MNKEARNQFKMIVFATASGLPLVSVKMDPSLSEEFLTPFFSSIHTYADMGGLDANETRIQINDMETIINRKDSLMLIGVFHKSMKKLPTMQENMYKMLELFADMYRDELIGIQNNEPIDMNVFTRFEVLINRQIQSYFEEIQNSEDSSQQGGMFGRLINIMKEKKKKRFGNKS